jgi:hypothetical protein
VAAAVKTFQHDHHQSVNALSTSTRSGRCAERVRLQRKQEATKP